jgi:hypothetical protein
MKNILWDEVLTAVNIQTPPNVVDCYQPFGPIYCLHLQDSMFLPNVCDHLPDYTVLGLHAMRYSYRQDLQLSFETRSNAVRVNKMQ